jgi:hypothetical protein
MSTSAENKILNKDLSLLLDSNNRLIVQILSLLTAAEDVLSLLDMHHHPKYNIFESQIHERKNWYDQNINHLHMWNVYDTPNLVSSLESDIVILQCENMILMTQLRLLTDAANHALNGLLSYDNENKNENFYHLRIQIDTFGIWYPRPFRNPHPHTPKIKLSISPPNKVKIQQNKKNKCNRWDQGDICWFGPNCWYGPDCKYKHS